MAAAGELGHRELLYEDCAGIVEFLDYRRVPIGNATGNHVTSWLNPLSLVIGALFVATSAYLAAVLLVRDARRAGASDLERYFANRALAAAVGSFLPAWSARKVKVTEVFSRIA